MLRSDSYGDYMNARILHSFDHETGRYNVSPPGNKGGIALLTREELTQLVFEAAKELGIMDFKCRDCSRWAEFKIQTPTEHHLVCSTHVEQSYPDTHTIHPLVIK